MTRTFRTIGVVGGGTRGRSIARIAAGAGIDVVVLELSEERIAEVRAEFDEMLDREIDKWGLTASEKKALLRRVRYATSASELADAELVVESIPEELDEKKRVLRELGVALPPERVLVTNTATLSLSEIAAASGRPDRVVGMHFAGNITTSPIVELVRALETSDATFATAREFALVLDKQAVEVFDSPGYVMTRAILPFLNEAMYLVLEGVASAEDVDKALRLGYEFKLGPLEYADRYGLDKLMTLMEHLFRELGDLKYRPCPLLRKLVRAGHTGRHAGHGFFTWDEDGRRVRSPDAAATGAAR